jgi:hypothetical protein
MNENIQISSHDALTASISSVLSCGLKSRYVSQNPSIYLIIAVNTDHHCEFCGLHSRVTVGSVILGCGARKIPNNIYIIAQSNTNFIK